MIAKTFEIRDRGTFIPVLAVKLDPGCEADRYLLGRAGYQTPSQYVVLMNINGGNGKATSDPYEWGQGSRTMIVAHDYIIKNFTWLNSGDVVCVEHILGERKTPKISERLEELNNGH